MKCPMCFHFLAPRPSYVCMGSCRQEHDAAASAVRGYDVSTAPITAGDHEGADCGICGVRTRQEACVRCAFPIPGGYRSADKVDCIAMAGARATGKSMMIAVAKEQLALLISAHHRSTLKGLGSTDERFHEAYAKPLANQRALRSTEGLETELSVSRLPLIFSFTERNSSGDARVRILVLRDVAGEDLETGQSARLEFFSRADFVFALIDPLTNEMISDMVKGLIPDALELGADGVKILGQVVDLMNGHRLGVKSPIRLAVIVSKFDVLQILRVHAGSAWAQAMNRPGAPVQRDPSMRAARYDPDQAELLDQEIRGLLELMGAGSLQHMLEESVDTYQFFGVSALGQAPDGEILHAGGIAPFRAVEPLKWALRLV